jgi:hypothetical protein
MFNCIYWTCWDVESVLINDGLIGGCGQRHSETLRASRKVSVIVTLHIQYEFQAILKMDLWFVKHFPLVYLCLFENLLLTNSVKRLLFKTKRQKKKKKIETQNPLFTISLFTDKKKLIFTTLFAWSVIPTWIPFFAPLGMLWNISPVYRLGSMEMVVSLI